MFRPTRSPVIWLSAIAVLRLASCNRLVNSAGCAPALRWNMSAIGTTACGLMRVASCTTTEAEHDPLPAVPPYGALQRQILRVAAGGILRARLAGSRVDLPSCGNAVTGLEVVVTLVQFGVVLELALAALLVLYMARRMRA